MESMLDHQNSNGRMNGATTGAIKNDAQATSSSSPRPSTADSPISSPPYWLQAHTRSVSNISIESIHAGAIVLQDNTDGQSDKNEACWAKAVRIDDHVVIKDGHTGIGAFVVWNIEVETLTGGSMRIRKRYSEFDELRNKLLQTFPNSEGAMPQLPPKSVISKFRPKFLEQRRIGLSYFLNCVLLNPEFSGSPVLKEFLFT